MGEIKKSDGCLSPYKNAQINQGCNFDLVHGALFARWYLHGVQVEESMWQSTADNSETHKSFRCRTSINPWRFLPPAAPWRFSLQVYLSGLMLRCRVYTACYPSLTIKQCQGLDWVSSSRWPSAVSHGCVSVPLLWAISLESSRPI